MVNVKSKISFLFVVFYCLSAGGALAHTYADSIQQYRKQYVDELLAEPRHPIKPSQVKYLNFYPPDPAYKVLAQVVLTPGATPFMVQTHSGRQKPFKEYCTVVFRLNGELISLHAYQSVDLMKDDAHKDDLFIMFNDMTNYETTYPGGRYIDLSLKDIVDGRIWVDFNKCYNPYCAYSDGFACPIPPKENSLRTEIKAGEKMFIH